MAVPNAAVNSVLRRRRSRAHFNYRLPEPAAERPRRAAATLEPGKCAESPGSVANEALAEPGHSGNDSDGAVAAANNAGDFGYFELKHYEGCIGFSLVKSKKCLQARPSFGMIRTDSRPPFCVAVGSG